MADNCTVLESWVNYQAPIETTSFAEEFVDDTDIIFTHSLQYNGSSSTTPDSSLSHSHTPTAPPPNFPPFDNISNHNLLPVGPSKKITKRKSRASKRSPTKYFTADPANFREMVQQVTGFQAKLLKPEPKRMVIPRTYRTTLLEMSPSMLHDEFLPSLPQPTVQQQGHLFQSFSVGYETPSFYPTLESWNGVIM